MSVNQGRNYVRLSLPDTVCSLATCHGDGAKVGPHLNIPQKLKERNKGRASGGRLQHWRGERKREREWRVALDRPGNHRNPLALVRHNAANFYMFERVI